MITTELDDYLKERAELKSRWEVVLSDGRSVYQDDERHGEPSWKRLRRYLELYPLLSIVKMKFGFRDNTIQLPDYADGYFFRYSILSCWGAWEKHSFICGHLIDGILTVMKYELPEMQYLGSEVRPIDESGESLILCPNNKDLRLTLQI